MRRKDREMDRDFGLYIIDKAKYCTLSTIYMDEPYPLPLSPIRIEDQIYFHGAMGGRKYELFKKNPLVRLVFVADVRVPKPYTKEEIMEMEGPEKIISKVFTTNYGSAIVSGHIEECKADDEKILGLKALCQKYTPDMMDFFDLAIKTSLDRTCVWRVPIDSITSKRKSL